MIFFRRTNLLRLIPVLFPALCWFLWSYVFTDKALYYSRLPLFVKFQDFMWKFTDSRPLFSLFYIIIVLMLFAVYFFFVRYLIMSEQFKLQFLLPVIIFYCLFFVFSNPALSYDLFNYMFDAKLVLKYGLDPHSTAAIQFIQSDDWVFFMRNIFFPTTYGYMWTYLSLIPFVIGVGRLLSVYIAFKLYAFLAFGILFFLQFKLLFILEKTRNSLWKLALFFASPLVLIEGISSAHNDIWMMVMAFTSLVLVFGKSKRLLNTLFRIALSFLFLLASSEIKRSTALLLPVWIFLISGQLLSQITKLSGIYRVWSKICYWWADVSALLLFVPLFTELSRQFHPWYLLWSFSFIPFVKAKIIRQLLLAFSFTSVLRYFPIIYWGNYTITIEQYQRLITWSAVPILLFVKGIYFIVRPRRRGK